ncbi:MAG: RNA polymerase sigma factor [Bacteroidota bacterium]|nr:RNA polymerase sigma factor [Bacteroidota bacterium]
MVSTDHELIEQSKMGNMGAFEQLIFRYDKDVLTLASRYTQSSDDAKDIYQEVFFRAYKGLKNFQARSEFSTWLYRITTNVCLTYHAREKKRAEIPLYDSDSDLSCDPVGSETSDAGIHGNEISERIQKALTILSPQQKIVFTLRHFHEYKLKDIAVVMDCAEGTVKKYLFEAMQKMRTQLKDLY